MIREVDHLSFCFRHSQRSAALDLGFALAAT